MNQLLCFNDFQTQNFGEKICEKNELNGLLGCIRRLFGILKHLSRKTKPYKISWLPVGILVCSSPCLTVRHTLVRSVSRWGEYASQGLAL